MQKESINASTPALALLLALSFWCTCPRALGDDNDSLHLCAVAESSAKTSEASSDWIDAAQQWLSLATIWQEEKSPTRGNQQELTMLASKRALACANRAYETALTETSRQSFTQRAEDQTCAYYALRACYDQLAKIDPENPLWYYLYGELEVSRGGYVDADTNLRYAAFIGKDQSAGQDASRLASRIGSKVQQGKASLWKSIPNSDSILQMMNQSGAKR